MRTTLDIDTPVLKELKRRQKAEGKSLGKLVSELLAKALREDRQPKAAVRFSWISRPMGARIDLTDKDAMYRAMDASE